MPEELWSLAVALAGEHGVSKTARGLRLGYYALKERVAATATAGAGSVSERRPAFVEMALGPLMPETPACVMELADARGVKLRVELRQRSPEEIASVVRALWGAAQ